MYKYTFILNSGKTDHIVSDKLINALNSYFQWRGREILNGDILDSILVEGYPLSKGSPYKVPAKVVTAIVETLQKQNTAELPPKTVDLQQTLCQDMKNTCPDGSNEFDPILQYEDWCNDIPYQEFVKNGDGLSQCYRLVNLLQAFAAGLEAEKGGMPLPTWPIDPVNNRTAIAPAKLNELYDQAKKAKVDIPEIFERFINAMNAGLFDTNAAMKGKYLGTSDQIDPIYIKGFVEPAREVLFSKEKVSEMQQKQEELDLEMAQKLAEQFK